MPKSSHSSFGSSKPGSGGRFKSCVSKVSHRGGVRNSKAVCASIGRHKYGKSRFQHMAAAGRRH